MIFRKTILAALLGLSAARDDTQKSSYLRRLQGNSEEGKKMKKPCTLLLRLEQFEDHSDKYGWDCELDDGDDSGPKIITFKDKTFKKDEFESGVSTLFGDVTIDSRGRATIKGNPIFGRRKTPNYYDDDRRSLQTTSEDNRPVLAVRVVANDIQTTANALTIADEIFGVNNDAFNLKTGFTRCSYNQLNFVPTTDSRVNGNDGVHTVTLNENVGGLTDSELRTKVVNALTAEFGSFPNEKIKYVMLCLPPISGFGGIAYAYINSWLSVYKDNWCNYPSAQMHEIGHNIGLAHSGETATYDDQTGMMGYSYSSDEGPAMCFNNAKNWQLGWYTDKRVVVDPLASSNWSGDLVGLAEYGVATQEQKVILQVSDSTLDYYIGFNRQVGINAGTQEGGNQVTIQRRSSGQNYAESDLVAKLGVGGKYTIPGFKGTTFDVVIEVTSIDTTSQPGVASVLVYKDGVTAAPVTSPPTKAPTKVPTKAPVTSAPTKAPVTSAPTKSPTKAPTKAPVTSTPTKAPVTSTPTKSPTKAPTKAPTVGPDCSSFSKRKDCNNASGCSWSGGVCKVSNPTPPSPPTNPPPSPSPPTNPPPSPSPCTGLSNKDCKNTPGCTWSQGVCVA